MAESSPKSDDDQQSHTENKDYSFISPISKHLPTHRISPSQYETPERARRLPRICEGQVYSPRCAQQTCNTVTLANFPVHRTPPSKLQNVVIRNPFEETLRENLDRPLVTPTLFVNVLSPSQETYEQFSWNIDDLANLCPARIDEFQNQSDGSVDTEIEKQIQEKIDRFFTSNINLESPWAPVDTVSRVTLAFHKTDCTPTRQKVVNMSFEYLDVPQPLTSVPAKKDAWAQTELSLPTEVFLPVETTMDIEKGDFKRSVISPRWQLRPSSPLLQEENITLLTSLDEPMASSPIHKTLLSSTVNNPSGSNYLTPVVQPSRSFCTPLRHRMDTMSPIGLSPIVSAVTLRLCSPTYWHSYSEEMHSDCDALSQTDLSLLPVVPGHVETVLRPYHTFTQEQSEMDDVSSLNSSFIRRRKLFHEEDNLDMSTASIHSVDKEYDSS